MHKPHRYIKVLTADNFSQKLFALFAATALGVMLIMPAGAGEGGRYFISGPEEGFAQTQVAVRHNFDKGFTSDLTPGQLKALERLDVIVTPVALYSISHHREGHVAGKPGGDSATRTAFPSDQTPWGIETLYNDVSVAVTSGGAGIDVAVLDTGVYTKHFDLSQRIAQCKDFAHPRYVVRSGCADKNGHGTHVAGTILGDAGADGLGIYGVAPEANLYAYKVCGDNGFCWADDIAAAIRHAADQGAEIISMSLGGDTASSLILSAVDYAVGKGVLVVAAAGNDGPALGSIDYPGAYVKVVAVGAIDSGLNVPSWSSRGVNDGDYVIEEQEVEYGAPGVAIESTWNDGAYKVISGTSMATPHVSGLAAKFWQGSASATRAYLATLASDIWVAGDDPATGFGLPHVR